MVSLNLLLSPCLRLSYSFVCSLYSWLVLLFILPKSSNLLASLKCAKSIKNTLPSLIISTNEDLFHPSLPPCSDISVSSFYTKHLLTANQIAFVLTAYFQSSNYSALRSTTGLSYCATFVTYYTTHHIPESLAQESVYGNLFHFDKPNSRLMAKCIIPISCPDDSYGPFQVLMPSTFSDPSLRSYNLCGDSTRVFTVFPRQTLHRDSVPALGHSRPQVMIQLVPCGRTSSLHPRYLAKTQMKMEPKFPELLLLSRQTVKY